MQTKTGENVRTKSSRTTRKGNQKKMLKEANVMDRRQQTLLIQEMSVARKKLDEENQLLRDELAEAKLVIRLLKARLDRAAAKSNNPAAMENDNNKNPFTHTTVTSNQSTVKKGIRGDVYRALDKLKQRLQRKAPTERESRRHAFKNPLFRGATTSLFQAKKVDQDANPGRPQRRHGCRDEPKPKGNQNAKQHLRQSRRHQQGEKQSGARIKKTYSQVPLPVQSVGVIS